MARSFTLFLSVLMLPFLFACEKMDEPQEYEITVEATVTQNFDLQIDFSNKDFPETIIPSLDGITEGEEGYILYSDVIEIDPNWGSEYVDLVSLNVVDDIIIENKTPGSSDLTKLVGLTLLTGDGEVIARVVEGGSGDQVKLNVEAPDLLSLAQKGQLEISLVATDLSFLEDISSLDVNLIIKANIVEEINN